MDGENNLMSQLWDNARDVDVMEIGEKGNEASFLEDDKSQPEGVKPVDHEGQIGDISQEEFFKDIDSDEKQSTKEDGDKESKDVKEKDPVPQVKKSDSPNLPYSLVFQSLVEQDSLSEFDVDEFNKLVEEQGEANAIVSVFQKEAEIARQQARDQVAEDQKLWMNLLDNGLQPKDAFDLSTIKSKYSSLDNESISGDDKEDLRKDVLKTYYTKVKGFSDEEAEEEIDNSIQLGKDEKKAIKAIDEINKWVDQNIQLKIKTEADRKTQFANQEKEIVNNYKTRIQSTDEYIPGQKVNKQTKDKIENLILSQDIFKKVTSDPTKYWTAIAYLETTGFFDKKGDKLINAGKTKAMDELNNALKRTSDGGLKANMQYEEDDDKEFDSMLSKKGKR